MVAPTLAEKSTKNKTISMEFFSGLISYLGVLDVADHEYEIRIWKMQIQYGESNVATPILNLKSIKIK